MVFIQPLLIRWFIFEEEGRILLKHDGNPIWVQHQRYRTNLTEQKKENNPNPKTTEQQSLTLLTTITPAEGGEVTEPYPLPIAMS